ncbi:hypothetical protein EV714DRAFT_245455 [Schizophyllum commune]
MRDKSSVSIELGERAVYMTEDGGSASPAMVRAELVMRLARPTRVTSIDVTLCGTSFVHWPEGHGTQADHNEVHIVHRESRTLFDASASENVDDDDDLPPPTYVETEIDFSRPHSVQSTSFTSSSDFSAIISADVDDEITRTPPEVYRTLSRTSAMSNARSSPTTSRPTRRPTSSTSHRVTSRSLSRSSSSSSDHHTHSILHLLSPWRAWKSHKDTSHPHDEPRLPVISVSEDEPADPHARATYKEFAAGTYTYPVAFNLPTGAPPTLMCARGSLRWKLVARVERAGSMAQHAHGLLDFHSHDSAPAHSHDAAQTRGRGVARHGTTHEHSRSPSGHFTHPPEPLVDACEVRVIACPPADGADIGCAVVEREWPSRGDARSSRRTSGEEHRRGGEEPTSAGEPSSSDGPTSSTSNEGPRRTTSVPPRRSVSGSDVPSPRRSTSIAPHISLNDAPQRRARLHYTLTVGMRSVSAGGLLPISLVLVPLARVNLHRVTVLIEEQVAYLSHMTDVVRVDGALPIALMKCKSGERVKGLEGEEVRTLSGDEVVELLDDEQPHAKAAACALEHSASASSSSHASPFSSHASPSTSHHNPSSHPTTFDPLSIYDPLTSATSSPSHPSPSNHLPSALHEPWALTTALRVPARGLRPTNENRAANVLITHALAVTMRVGVRPGEEVGRTSQDSTRTSQNAEEAARTGDQPRRSSEADDRRRSGLSAGVNLAEVVLEEKLFDVTIRMPVHVYSPLCTPDALCLPMYEEEDSGSSHSDDRSTDDERIGRDRRHIRRVAEAAAGVVPWI